MNNNKEFFKSALIAGLIMTGVLVLTDMVVYALDFMEHTFLVGLVTLAISVTCYIYFGRNYRNKYLGGFMTYGKSYLFIIMMAVVFGLIYGVYNYVFLAFFDPERLQQLIEIQLNSMKAWGMPDDILAQQEERIRSSTTVLSTSLYAILGGIMNGGLFGLIVALFVRKKETLNDVF